jgi:hypothetical protein
MVAVAGAPRHPRGHADRVCRDAPRQ